jgi:hypothetical protein
MIDSKRWFQKGDRHLEDSEPVPVLKQLLTQITGKRERVASKLRRTALKKYIVTLTAEKRRDLSASMAADEATLIFSVAHTGFSLNRRWSTRRYDLDISEVRP